MYTSAFMSLRVLILTLSSKGHLPKISFFILLYPDDINGHIQRNLSFGVVVELEEQHSTACDRICPTMIMSCLGTVTDYIDDIDDIA